MLVRRLATLAVTSLALSACAGTPSATPPPSSSATPSSATPTARAVAGTESLVDACVPGADMDLPALLARLGQADLKGTAHLRGGVNGGRPGEPSASIEGDLDTKSGPNPALHLTVTVLGTKNTDMFIIDGFGYVASKDTGWIFTKARASNRPSPGVIDPLDPYGPLQVASKSVSCLGPQSDTGVPGATFRFTLTSAKMNLPPEGAPDDLTVDVTVDAQGKPLALTSTWPQGFVSMSYTWGVTVTVTPPPTAQTKDMPNGSYPAYVF